MKPTMKLRWVGWLDAKSGTAPKLEGPDGTYVLQQWWEGTQLKKQFQHLPPGTIIPLQLYETVGEWRDIPIEVEG